MFLIPWCILQWFNILQKYDHHAPLQDRVLASGVPTPNFFVKDIISGSASERGEQPTGSVAKEPVVDSVPLWV